MTAITRGARAITTIATALALALGSGALAGSGGACCFPGGECQQVASEDECLDLGGILLPGDLCAEGACTPAACCDGLNCGVADAYACISAGRTYAGAGVTCFDDPCESNSGACCFDDGSCAALSPDDCKMMGGVWLGAGTFCDFGPCELGACCLPGDCFDGASYECDAAGGLFALGASCAAGGCDVDLGCPLDSLYSQQRDDPEGFTAFTSEASSGFIRFDSYAGAAGTIEGLRWWGVDLRLVGGDFVECDETENIFQISFYEDFANEPGDLVCQYTIPVTATPTGVMYLEAELIEYRVDLPEPCILVEGWLSLVGMGDPDCWFLWMSSPDGDGTSLCENCESFVQGRDLSFCVLGTTGGVFGACCNLSTGECMDDVEITECAQTGLDFVPEATCAELDPPCAVTTGACCLTDGNPCFVDTPDACIAAGGDWVGGNSACDACPIIGACCFDVGICGPETEDVCNQLGYTWLGPNTFCEDCPEPPVCPGGSLVSQDPDGPSDFLAGTSEQGTLFKRFEDIAGVSGPVEEVRFWGVDLDSEGAIFLECVEDDPTFEIGFYTDAGGVPGAEICVFTVTATRTPVGIIYNGTELNEYHAVLPEPCVLTNGWISIEGAGDPECWFLWMSAGFGGSYCTGCEPSQQSEDYSFCLIGTPGGVFGACCDDGAASCTEDVEITDCLSSGLRFVPGASCAELDPPCGVIVGACCFADATCAIMEEAPCQTAGGDWIGADTVCSLCPCLTPCPAGGLPEGEPVCSDGYVDEFNGGCTSEMQLFQPIELGDTICGESGIFFDGGDAVPEWDWYELTTISTLELTWTVEGQFPLAMGIIDGNLGCDGVVLAAADAVECDEISVTAEVPPGTYWLVVVPAAFTDEATCGVPYTAALTGGFPCPADTNGDQIVDVQDLTAVILAWGTNDEAADITGDGIVDVEDLTQMILNWGSCGTLAGAASPALELESGGAQFGERTAGDVRRRPGAALAGDGPTP